MHFDSYSRNARMNTEPLFKITVSLPRTADVFFGPALQLPAGVSRPSTMFPPLRVLPGPEADAPVSWLSGELRQCARFESYQDMAFLVLGMSGLAAIIWAFAAAYA